MLAPCDPARIQTWNLLIRSQILYSVKLRGRLFYFSLNLKPSRSQSGYSIQLSYGADYFIFL